MPLLLALALGALCPPLAAGAEAAGPDWHAQDVLPGQPRSAEEAARIAAILAPPRDFTAPEAHEALPGGAATAPGDATGGDAYLRAMPALSPQAGLDFQLGAALFARLWVPAPSSTRAADGLGPYYNARSCLECHPGNGRGHPPDPADPGANRVSMVLKLALPGEGPMPHPEMQAIAGYLATRPDPQLGGQLQDHALPGMAVEGRLDVAYQAFPVPLAGGETVLLRRPAYSIGAPLGGTLSDGLMLSPRIAPPVFGLGLLEAVPAAEIAARADPDDADGDGISGRVNLVWSREAHRPMLGRFGWKAGQPSLREQAANAFSEDIGISSPLFPEGWGDCTAEETDCRAAPDGNDAERDWAELDAAGLALVARHVAEVAVPPRRDFATPQVLQGKRIFHESGCAACHVPKLVTARLDEPGAPQSFQLIWPYSDLLLHDMGPDLADGRPESLATGQEWRTPPLWGIGLASRVQAANAAAESAPALARAFYLHDGRARSLLEAILWHGGEAQAARDRVVALPPEDRAALIRFLESL